MLDPELNHISYTSDLTISPTRQRVSKRFFLVISSPVYKVPVSVPRLRLDGSCDCPNRISMAVSCGLYCGDCALFLMSHRAQCPQRRTRTETCGLVLIYKCAVRLRGFGIPRGAHRG